RPELQAECLRDIDEAIRLDPGRITLKGTRGSILALMGRDIEAETVLTEVLEKSECEDDHRISRVFLAMLAAGSYREDAAREFLEKAKPWPEGVERVAKATEKVLGSRRSPVSASDPAAATVRELVPGNVETA